MRVAAGLVARRAQDLAMPRGFPRDASRWSAVVVDVLRATTTLTLALENGARAIEAYATTEAALERRDRARDGSVLACGERGGQMVPGFDLGNSPLEYTAERVAGRTLAFASSNGSLALGATAGCARCWLGAFVNAGAVLEAVWTARPDFVWIACAGNEGRFSLEDAAFAGWLGAHLAERGATLEGAPMRLAAALSPAGADAVRAAVEGSSHGRALRRLGPAFAHDVEFCATLDSVGRAFEV